MVRYVPGVLVAVTLLACTQQAPQGSTGGMSTGTGTTGSGSGAVEGDSDAYDEGCTGSQGTGGVFSYSEAWIVDPSDPAAPFWKAPRQMCELSTIVDLDIAADGALYALGTSFIHKDACGDACPWRYWVRRISAGGEEEWAKTFAFPPLDLRAVRALADGSVVIGGAAVGQDRAPWLARVDAAGALLWQNSFAERGQINAIARGPDDVVVAVGSVEAGDTTDLWVVQVTSGGALEWTSTLGDDRDPGLVAVVVDAAGRSWIVGGHAAEPIEDSISTYLPFFFNRTLDQPLVALIDDQGALLWLDEPAPIGMDTVLGNLGLGIDLLPGGDAVAGVSWDDQSWIARYAGDGSRVWEKFLVLPADYSPYVDELACDVLGHTHVLASGVIVQLDDAGDEIGTLKPETYGDQLALTPDGALRVSHWRYKGEYYETWGWTGG